MPLFLFVSGLLYAMTKRDESYISFLGRKFRRLVIPYLSTSIIVIAIKLLTEKGVEVENPVSVVSFVEMFYLPAAGYYLWFIWVIWWMFIIVPLLKSPKVRLLALSVAFVVHLAPFRLPDIFCLEELRKMGVYFMLGACAMDYSGILTRILSVPLWITGLVFVAFEYLCMNSAGMVGFLNYNIASLVGIIAIIKFSRCVCPIVVFKGKWLLTVAGCSYLIYLFHTTFEGFAKAAFGKLLSPTTIESYFVPVALTVICCGVLIPIFLQKKIIIRSKLLSYAFGLSYPGKQKTSIESSPSN